MIVGSDFSLGVKFAITGIEMALEHAKEETPDGAPYYEYAKYVVEEVESLVERLRKVVEFNEN